MALPMDLNWFRGGFIRGENGIGGARPRNTGWFTTCLCDNDFTYTRAIRLSVVTMWRHVLAIYLLIALATEAVVVRLNVALGCDGYRRHDRSRHAVADQAFAPADMRQDA